MEYQLTEQERLFFQEKQQTVTAIQGQISGGLELLARLHGLVMPIDVSPGFEQMRSSKGGDEANGRLEAMADTRETPAQAVNGAFAP